jgi:hypothetical protein
VSDDSPNKGWDGWFATEPSTPGGERPEPEQNQVPAEPEPEPETPAEQTDWTVPPVREEAAPEPEPEAEPEPEPTSAPEPEVEPEPVSSVWTPAAVEREQPEHALTQVVTPQQADVPDANANVDTSADAAPTQIVSSPTVDAAPTQIVASPTMDVAPTQVVSPQTPAEPWQPPQPALMWGEAGQGGPVQQQPSQGRQQPQRGYAAAAPAAGAAAAEAGPQAQPTQVQPPQATQSSPVYHVPPPTAQAYRSEPPTQNGFAQAPPNRPSAASADAFEDDERRPSSRKKVYLASGIGAAAIVGLVAVLVFTQGSSGSGSAAAKPSGFQPTGTSVTGDAEQTAAAFLAAWESGNFKQAASYTDNVAAAQSTLSAYSTNLNLNGLQLKATGSTALAAAASASASTSSSTAASASASASASYGAAAPTGTAGAVTFSVVAKVGLPASATSTASSSSSSSASTSASASASSSASTSSAASSVTANWSYSSKVVAYKKNGGWWIQWDPSLVAPNLTANEKVVSVALSPSAAEVTDDSGNDLSSATDPGVHNIYTALKKSAPVGQGTPGVEIVLEKADGTQISSSVDVLSQPVNTGVVKTTINAKAEAAAQAAVQKYSDSSMVVLQASTGHIVAVANNDGGNDFALTARIAPGSTNKIITATALLTSGLVSSPSQAVECPAKIVVDGTTFANSGGESKPAGTPFLTDFAISCNNAFGQWYDKIGSTTLAQTAEKYYGLNQQWNLGTGLAGPYYQIPSSASNGELFQELFGQGQLEAAPLAMASVAATVDSGSFKQPIVVDGASQMSATSLPSNVQQDLWQMMKAVVTESDGTAAGVFNSVNSTVYGKTGTADVGSGQDKPNSWMVVFDPKLDLAIGCVVLDAGYGAEYAGPETAAVLAALQ